MIGSASSSRSRAAAAAAAGDNHSLTSPITYPRRVIPARLSVDRVDDFPGFEMTELFGYFAKS